jgi:putative hemolysin
MSGSTGQKKILYWVLLILVGCICLLACGITAGDAGEVAPAENPISTPDVSPTPEPEIITAAPEEQEEVIPDEGFSGYGAIANPASTYCMLLGYSTEITDSASGQSGVCIFPDGSSCEEWDFFNGKCGEEFSYCGQNGYSIVTLTDGGTYSQEYAACVDESGEIIGSVAELSGLLDKLDESQGD